MRTPAPVGGGRPELAERAGADNTRDTPSVPARLDRTTFAISRAAEFLERRALQSQTGQPAHRFGDVIVKELMDNALDAAESAGVAPRVRIGTEIDGGELLITVADNGPGLAPEVLAGVLDFSVLVSDKAAYRSPTRGLQGNALKTVVGIPFALGVTTPLIVESLGVRHEVAVSIDPGGRVAVHYGQTAGSQTEGTSVTVPLPAVLQVDTARWARAFAICNPHAEIEHTHGAEHAHSAEPGTHDFYKPTVGDGWHKPVPTDPTSAHWYDVAALTKLVYAHIGDVETGGRDLPLGEFVRQFAGLTSTIKAKKVAAALPEVRHLSDLRGAPELISVLLGAMQGNCTAPKPTTALGGVPEQHYLELLDRWYGVRSSRFWFKRKTLVDDSGLPWVIEAAAAETEAPGEVFYAVNYSPTFSDPLAGTPLSAGEVSSAGVESFLRSCDAYPDPHNDRQRAAVIHVICPALEFLDKGKSTLAVPPAVREAAAAVLASVGKTLRTEREAAQRDARKAQRRREQRMASLRESAPSWSLKAATFEVLPAAVAAARGAARLPFSQRSVLYQVRPRIQPLTDKELTQDYFSTLLVAYQREHGPLDGLYYEPRGELHEPHTGTVVRLGTREVATYIPPNWTYNKILYVEKQGLYPVLEASGLAERHDLAVVAGQGYAPEACRELIAAAEGRDWQIFVVHDADPDGYSIARTLAEPTDRMPHHSVDVIDLGLTVADAIRYGLQTEKFTRRKALASKLDLDDLELDWFTGTQTHWGRKPQWACTRVELNAFTGPQLIAYIEAGLEAHGATGKVIPPDAVLVSEAHAVYDSVLADTFDELLDELLDRPRLLATVATEMPYQVDPAKLREYVTKALAANRQLPWRHPARDDAALAVHRRREQLRARLVDLLNDRASA